jgi:hypothetical protein
MFQCAFVLMIFPVMLDAPRALHLPKAVRLDSLLSKVPAET